MKKFSLKKIQEVLLFLYMFFLSFLNFTPFYLISAILLVIVTVLKITKNKKIVLTKYFYFEIFFIIYNFFYCIAGWSINKEHTLEMLRTLVLNLAINTAIMNTIDSKKDINKIMKWMIPISAFACIFIIIYTGGSGNGGRLAHGVARPFGKTRYTSMEFASWAIYAGTIALLGYLKTRKKEYLIVLPLFWIVIIWCGSRKWIVFGILLQFFIYIFNTDKIKAVQFIKKLFIITAIAGFMIVIILKNQTLYNIVGYRFIGYLNKTESSAISRDKLKKTAIKYIKQNPIKGYGLNTFKDISKYKNWSESNYLELAFGGGILLPIIYYSFLIYISFLLFKIRNKNISNKLLMFIMIMLIFSDVVSMSYQGRLESFMITLSSIAIYLDKKNRRDNINENCSTDVNI